VWQVANEPLRQIFLNNCNLLKTAVVIYPEKDAEKVLEKVKKACNLKRNPVV
jgi:hypothetical protein